jgi:ABC-type Fe3+ transport system permease subunit
MLGAARLLLIPIALLALLASLAPLIPIVSSGREAWISAASQPGFAQTMWTALAIAAFVAAPALLLGLVLARSLQRVSAGTRALALTGCVVLLLMPAPGVSALPRLDAPDRVSIEALLYAAARAAAAVSLVLTAGLARVSPSLLVAARAAGAGRFRAWRDAVLAPLAGPLVLAALAACLIGLDAGPLASPLIKEFPAHGLLTVAPALLVGVASIAALGVLLRRRPA